MVNCFLGLVNLARDIPMKWLITRARKTVEKAENWLFVVHCVASCSMPLSLAGIPHHRQVVN